MLTLNDKYMDNRLTAIFTSTLLRSKFYNVKSNALHFTPLKLWDIMLGKIEEKDSTLFDGTKRILVFRDHFLAELVRQRLPKGKRNNLFFAFDDNDDTVYRLVENRVVNKENIITGDILTNKELKKMPKFDVVIGNPPYDGKSQKHQKFFNLAVDLVKSDGYVAFLQPATPYIIKRVPFKKQIHNDKMKKNLKRYKTSAWLFNPNCYFAEADITNILAVTILEKVNNDSQLLNEVVCEFTGETKILKNIELENVTIHADDSGVVTSIKEKITNWIKINGSLSDVINGEPKQHCCSLGQCRGTIKGRGKTLAKSNEFFSKDFFTLVGKDIQKHIARDKTSYRDFDVFCDTQEQAINVYYYFTTKFARFCLSLFKYSTHNENGETDLVPLMDFNRKWTNDELFNLFNLTIDERTFIDAFIEDFYKD